MKHYKLYVRYDKRTPKEENHKEEELVLLEQPLYYLLLRVYHCWGFPGGAVVENPPADAGDTGLSPGPGTSHMPRSN